MKKIKISCNKSKLHIKEMINKYEKQGYTYTSSYNVPRTNKVMLWFFPPQEVETLAIKRARNPIESEQIKWNLV